MLRANEPERYLPHKTCFKFVTQTTVNTYEPETYFFLIHQVINFSQKTCWPLVNQKHICLINHVKNLSHNPLKKGDQFFLAKESSSAKVFQNWWILYGAGCSRKKSYMTLTASFKYIFRRFCQGHLNLLHWYPSYQPCTKSEQINQQLFKRRFNDKGSPLL